VTGPRTDAQLVADLRGWCDGDDDYTFVLLTEAAERIETLADEVRLWS